MGEPGRWKRRVEEFVLGQIGDAPTRVLEVGCGEGELARAVARAGHSVIAIDPRAPEGAPFDAVRVRAVGPGGAEEGGGALAPPPTLASAGRTKRHGSGHWPRTVPR